MSDATAQAQQEIAALRQQLAQAQQALEDFNYAVSHDLRAPLRHVRSYLQIVQEDMGDSVAPAIAGHLRTAGDAAAQMGRMIDALLELSRVRSAQLHAATLDPLPLIEQARREVEPLQAGDRVVEWRIAPHFPLLQADPALTGGVFMRLLANALKFTRHVPHAVVEVGWRTAAEGWCELFVRDNGAGFDPRFIDRLFQVFQRLHSTREFEGLGAGLAYARLVVERHGGTMQARGDLAPGCEVCFTLPLAAGAAA